MDRDIYVERVAQAIRDGIPEHSAPKSWFGCEAIDLNISEKQLRRYAKGETECPGSVLLAMFDHWGAAFEARVRGTEPPQDDLAQDIREVLEKHDNGSRAPKLVKTP